MNQESGRSMVEMLGVLAIMGIITVGAITMISAAMRNQKRSVVQDEVAQLVTGVRTLLGEYDDFSNLDNSTIFAAIGMSDKNPYNGKYILEANPSDYRQFSVSITGLSKTDCEFFRQKGWSDSAPYLISDGKIGGAEASPANCSAENGRNVIRIVYGG